CCCDACVSDACGSGVSGSGGRCVCAFHFESVSPGSGSNPPLDDGALNPSLRRGKLSRAGKDPRPDDSGAAGRCSTRSSVKCGGGGDSCSSSCAFSCTCSRTFPCVSDSCAGDSCSSNAGV